MASHSSRRDPNGDVRWANGTIMPLPGKTPWRETNPSEAHRLWLFSMQSSERRNASRSQELHASTGADGTRPR
jgi:hypothetical protein